MNQEKAAELKKAWQSNQPIFEIHTSGSTGVPKNIQLERSKMEVSARMTLDFLGIKENDSALISLNVSFVGGLMMLIRSLVGNLSYKIVEPSSNPLQNISQSFDFLSFVPLQIQTILTESPEKVMLLNRAKAILIGGAGISDTLENMIQGIEAPVYHTYGMTETISHIALRRVNGAEKSDYFTVFENIEITTNLDSCLCIKSEITDHNWLVTNDIVELIENKSFKVLGRVDDVINSGGVKILPSEVEKTISQYLISVNYNDSFFVSSIPHTLLGNQLVFVSLNSFQSNDYEQMKAILKPQMKQYYFPNVHISLPVFEITDSGKIDKRKTIEKYLSRLGEVRL